MLNRNKSITPPSAGQYANALLWTSIAATGSGASLYLNTTFGWQYGVIAAVGFGLADLGFFSTSLVVRQAQGWKIKLRAMQAVFLALSIIAAASHLLEIFEQRANEAAAIAAKIETARQKETAARGELARISETGDAKALEAEHKALTDRVTLETAQGGCMKKCKEAGDKATALLPRIGAAKRRDELNASLTQASQIVAETPKQAVGGIATLAKLTGISEEEIGARAVAIIMAGLLLAFLLASMMAEDAGEMWAKIIEQRRACRESRIAPKNFTPTVVASIAAQPGQVTLSQPKSVEEEMLITVQMLVMHSPGQQLRTSIRKLAEHLQVARATLQDWMQKWRDEGKISYRTAGNETIFQLPRAA